MTIPRKAEDPRKRLLAPVKHWTVMAKFFLCDGLRRGIITIPEAAEAHSLSIDELTAWYARFSTGDGVNPLRKINKRRAA